MAVSVGAGRKSGRGRRGVPRYRAMADITMTPFIDVMRGGEQPEANEQPAG